MTNEQVSEIVHAITKLGVTLFAALMLIALILMFKDMKK